MVQPSAFPCFSIAVLFIFPYCTSRAICLGEPVVVRTEWRISGRWLLKDQTEHISEGARRVCQHFETRPHSVLTLRDDAQRLLLGPLDSLYCCRCPRSPMLLAFWLVILELACAVVRSRAGFCLICSEHVLPRSSKCQGMSWACAKYQVFISKKAS